MVPANPLFPYMEILLQKQSLSETQAGEAISTVMKGEATPAQIAALLAALHSKGETLDEIVGAAQAMRSHAVPIPTGRDHCIDTCGTGGDNSHTFNISTTTALVVAGLGVPVAKHGNRSATSQCGSIDLLEALGVNIELRPEQIANCLDTVGIGILFARMVHPAMKHAAPVRSELGFRTIFNFLGPLTNPARPAFQLVGISNLQAMHLYAECLQRLGIQKAWVVSGPDGVDELVPFGETQVVEVNHDSLHAFTVTPGDFGMQSCRLEDLRGGAVEDNLAITRAILSGAEQGPKRDTILMNAGAALYVAGAANTIQAGVSKAAQCIDTGKAQETLDRLIQLSQE